MLDFIQNISSIGPKWLSYLCGAGAVFIFVYNIFPDTRVLAARKRLGMEDESIKPKTIGIFKIFYPLYSTLASLFFAGFLPNALVKWIEKKRPLVKKKLIIANLRNEITPDEFIAFGWVMLFVIPVTFYFFFGLLGMEASLIMHLGIWLFAFFFADIWLSGAAKKRQKAIVRALPAVLDLLTLSVEAGLDFIGSIQRMSKRTSKNALMEEFDELLKEIRLGTARSDALRNMSQRLDIDEVASFVTLLIQADQLGSPIGLVLRAQSDQLRSKRFQRAEAAGARASQLILLPLIFCIFPAVFIVIMGPMVVKFLVQGSLF